MSVSRSTKWKGFCRHWRSYHSCGLVCSEIHHTCRSRALRCLCISNEVDWSKLRASLLLFPRLASKKAKTASSFSGMCLYQRRPCPRWTSSFMRFRTLMASLKITIVPWLMDCARRDTKYRICGMVCCAGHLIFITNLLKVVTCSGDRGVFGSPSERPGVLSLDILVHTIGETVLLLVEFDSQEIQGLPSSRNCHSWC